MQRFSLTCLILSLTAATALASACTANLKDGCVGGECTTGTPGMGGGASAAQSGAGGGDAGAEGGPTDCTGKDPPATGDFPCAVFDVIHRDCNPCHTMPPKNNAPFPLLTFEDTQAPYGPLKVYQVMNTQVRPGGAPRMPLGADFTDPMLQADLKILEDWLDQCAPPEPEGMGCECPGQGCN